MVTTNLDKITVTGQYLDYDGNPLTGSIVFTSNQIVIDVSGKKILFPKQYTTNLDSNGQISIAIPASDDPNILPTLFTYTITENVAGGRTLTNVTIPYSALATGYDLSLLLSSGSGTPTNFNSSPATTTTQGIVKLANDLGGTADLPTTPTAVHLTGAETVAGVKTFSSSPVVPTPTTSGQAVNKSYVDSALTELFFNVMDYGATGNGTTNDTVAIQNAINAVPRYGTLFFPTPTNYYKIDNPLTPAANDVTFMGANLRVEIHQAGTTPLAIFDLIDHPGCSVKSLTLVLDHDKRAWSATPGPNRGDTAEARSAAVWTNVSDTVVQDVVVVNFVIGVYISAWSTATNTFKRGPRYDCVVEDLEAVGVDWGVLAIDTDRIVLRRIVAHDHIASTSNPMHTLYISGTYQDVAPNYPDGLWNSNVTISDIGNYKDRHSNPSGSGAPTSTDAYGNPGAFKCIKGGTISNIWADDCNGIIGCLDLTDVRITNLVGTNIINPGLGGGNSLGVTQTQAGRTARISIDGVRMTIVNDAPRPVSQFDSDDSVYRNFEIHTYRDGSTTTNEMTLTGNRNKFESIRINNYGPANAGRGILVGAGAGSFPTDSNVINGLELHNSLSVIDMTPTTTNTYIHVNQNLWTNLSTANPNATSYIAGINGTNISFILSRENCVRETIINGTGITVYTRWPRESVTQVKITNNSTFTIASFALPPVGMTHTVRIFNNTASAHGTITWSDITLKNGTVAVPANQVTDIQLFYNGTTWIELGRI